MLLERIRSWARSLKRDAVTLWFAYKHPATPMLAKALCIVVVAYALSPIDLIPDFIPILGYVDDAILLPGLIWLAIKLVPPQVLDECRQVGDVWIEKNGSKPRSYVGAVIIVIIWILFMWWLWDVVASTRLKTDTPI